MEDFAEKMINRGSAAAFMPGKNASAILNRNLFFVKNVVSKGEAKTQDKLDVYDPESRQILLECREPDIGLLTKIARFCGGVYDRGASFNLVAGIADSGERMLRIVRGNATFSFGGAVVKIFDGQDSLVGKLKRKNFSLGERFDFIPDTQGESFTLHFKGGEIFCDDKKVAAFSRSNSAFYAENKFNYAFSISPEVPASSQMREVLLAFGLAKHRIILKSTFII